MQLIAPVTDYIPASVLTDLNDIVVRGAVLPERQPGLLKSIGLHMGSFTRNAPGDQVVGGVPFNASLYLFNAVDTIAGNVNLSWGFDDGTLHRVTGIVNDNTENIHSDLNSIVIQRGVGDLIYGFIDTISGTGFTFTWFLVGASSADIEIIAIP